MQLAISDLLFPGFTKANLRHLPGQYGIEFFYEFGKDYYWNEEVAAWGLRSLSIHGPCVAMDLATGDRSYLAIMEKTLAYAKKIGAQFVVVHTNEVGAAEKQAAQALVKKRLAKVLALGKKYGVTIVIENVGLRVKRNVIFDLPDYLDLFQTFPQARALLDTGHAHVNGWDIPAVIHALQGRLIGYHIHDNDGSSDAHLPVGQGTITWESVFDTIKKYTPQATLVCEYSKGFDNIPDLVAHVEQLKGKYGL